MQGIENIKKALLTMPEGPGVYRFIDKNDRVMYVGKAKNLKNRVSNYINVAGLSSRIARMVFQVDRLEIVVTRTESEALLFEANLIKSLKPPYNILLRDDKTYPYISIDNNHDFPRIKKHRGEKKKNVSYFGPYPSAFAIKQTISVVQKVFLMRPCKDSFFASRKRPCIEYQIKKCSAPCVNYITKEDYSKIVNDVKDMLKGRNNIVKEGLQKKMEEASDTLEFEKAAEYRNKITALNAIQVKQYINTKTVTDADIIGIIEAGGNYCIQVLIVRNNNFLGNSDFYPARTEGLSKGEVMELFMAQFYQENPAPKIIVISDDFEEREALQKGLSDFSGYKIEIVLPQKGERFELVNMALKNAKTSIERKLAEQENVIRTLNKVQEIFSIKEAIRKIEVFDNSHIFGKNAVGGMIVAGFDEEGRWTLMKKFYRKFNVEASTKTGAVESNIPTNLAAAITGGDDYYMLKQVMERRYGRLKKDAEAEGLPATTYFPELILIDGGLGQFSTVKKVFEEMGIYDKVNFVCIAKGPDRNAGREDFYTKGEPVFKLEPNDSVLYFLQNLRDEVHRFAITGHRAKRDKSQFTSILDDIEGIGTSRKRMLLNHFGSAKAVKEAKLADIEKVKGISKKLAKQIAEQLEIKD